MGREVRRVPKGWEHPLDDQGRYVPLFNSMSPEEFERQVAKWYADEKLWLAGTHPDQKEYGEGETRGPFEEWDGGPLRKEDHMPLWPDAERTHFVLYETTTEGTPLSPAFASRERLASWLARHIGGEWLSFIRDNCKPPLPKLLTAQAAYDGMDVYVPCAAECHKRTGRLTAWDHMLEGDEAEHDPNCGGWLAGKVAAAMGTTVRVIVEAQGIDTWYDLVECRVMQAEEKQGDAMRSL